MEPKNSFILKFYFLIWKPLAAFLTAIFKFKSSAAFQTSPTVPILRLYLFSNLLFFSLFRRAEYQKTRRSEFRARPSILLLSSRRRPFRSAVSCLRRPPAALEQFFRSSKLLLFKQQITTEITTAFRRRFRNREAKRRRSECQMSECRMFFQSASTISTTTSNQMSFVIYKKKWATKYLKITQKVILSIFSSATIFNLRREKWPICWSQEFWSKMAEKRNKKHEAKLRVKKLKFGFCLRNESQPVNNNVYAVLN